MAELADPIQETVLTRNGSPVAVVLGIDAYKSIRALINFAASDPKRFQEMLNRHFDVQSGNFRDSKSLEELEEYLANLNSGNGS